MPTKKSTKRTTSPRKSTTKKVASTKKNRVQAAPPRLFESDSAYFLKLVIVVILGTLWLKFQTPLQIGILPLSALPVGLLIGFLVVKSFEVHQDDRKIWYAVLVLIGITSYFLPAGILI